MITYQEPLTFGLHMSAVGTSTALSMNTMLNNIIQMMHYQNMVIEEQNKHIWEMEESQDKAGRGRLCTPWREKHSSTLQYYRRGRSYATAKRSKPPRHSLVEKIKKVIETGTSKKAYPKAFAIIISFWWWMFNPWALHQENQGNSIPHWIRETPSDGNIRRITDPDENIQNIKGSVKSKLFSTTLWNGAMACYKILGRVMLAIHHTIYNSAERKSWSLHWKPSCKRKMILSETISRG